MERMLETIDDRVVFFDSVRKEIGFATKSTQHGDGTHTMVLSVYVNLERNKGNQSLISIFENALAILQS